MTGRIAQAGFFLLSLACAAALIGDPPRYAPSPVTQTDRDRASAYLAENLPELPDWSWQNVPFKGGFVRTGSSGNKDANVTILFIPGYTGSIEFYSGFYQPWYERGYRVMALDLPGQGGSSRRADNPEKPWTGNFAEYGDIVAHTIRVLDKEVSGKLIIVGDSFGSHAALRAITDHPDLPVDGLVAMVPALEIYTPGSPEWAAKGYARLMTMIGMGRLYAPGQTNWAVDWRIDPETFRCGQRADRVFLNESLFSLRPTFRVGGVTNEWVTGLESSGKAISENGSFNIPVTFVLAAKDQIVNGERARKLCTDNPETCRLVTLPAAEHCILLEDEDTIDVVLGTIDQLVEQLTGP